MLQACLNGGRTKAFHPFVPFTPSELADDARATIEAGAVELHLHPRGKDGLESLDPDDVAAALKTVRASVPGTPVGLSTGWWISPGGRARQNCIRQWTVLPDYVSVNLIEEDAPEIIALALEKGIGIEAGLWSVEDARRFIKLADVPRCLRILVEINTQEESEGLAVANAILGAFDEARITLPRLLHGNEATMWPLYREALRRGLDTRIGLEDGANLPSGKIAANNAALIIHALQIAGD